MGKVFATWKKRSQHTSQNQNTLQHDPTADMLPYSNRVAGKVSDASTRIGRPGTSSSDKTLYAQKIKTNYDLKWMW
jgi:hypothetical protein